MSGRDWLALAILTVARTWTAEFEWYAHANEALGHGVAPVIVESIRLGRAPDFANESERVVYRYATGLQANRRVSDESYNAAPVRDLQHCPPQWMVISVLLTSVTFSFFGFVIGIRGRGVGEAAD